MSSVSLKAIIGEDRKLSIVVPPEIPVGEVEITIHAAKEDTAPAPAQSAPQTRHSDAWWAKVDQLRERLAAEGKLQAVHLPTRPTGNYQFMTDEERPDLRHLPVGAKTTEEIINEDREDRA